ncbi:FeoC-like transcriptional regulator [Thiomicrorhabdus xiamenensis]|uniref:Transcriptional regulator n=1 Tax=Thiomicrorhabdus xiamenensis TaxID=2739063 RepID=A0A7D4P3W5_9GAMM|nr:FeoC-like transcriptional regulator [Thiomicrorhabdus xiamenensis]QKI88495.1 transcriptional regulator [Thiomicrorhabdus xiamenensis]
MILLDIKRYIRQRERVSLDDIINRFDLSRDAAEGLLQPLISQGHIQSLSASCSTGRCSSACQSNQTYYQWLDNKLRQLNFPVQLHANNV